MVLITEKIILINPVDRINGSRPLRFAAGTALFFAGDDKLHGGRADRGFLYKNRRIRSFNGFFTVKNAVCG